MKIYLIRHGETPWNRESRIQGREDVPLSRRGLAQARECAAGFAGVPLSAVLTSPLSRAHDTARLIADTAGAPLFVEPDLTERDFGSISGRVVDIFHPENYATDLEPLDAVAARAMAVLFRYGQSLSGDFAAVSHGGTINAVLRAVSHGQVGSGKTRLLNAHVNILELRDGVFHVSACNIPPAELKERIKGN